jgi:hypothetical protein
MKKILLFILAFLVPSLAYAQPSITFQDEVHDFGEVLQGTEPEHTFEFSNSGTEDLEITKVSTS